MDGGTATGLLEHDASTSRVASRPRFLARFKLRELGMMGYVVYDPRTRVVANLFDEFESAEAAHLRRYREIAGARVVLARADGYLFEINDNGKPYRMVCERSSGDGCAPREPVRVVLACRRRRGPRSSNRALHVAASSAGVAEQ